MRWIVFGLTALLTLVLVYFLNTKPGFLMGTPAGNLPPLGKLLDPFAGFWQNAEMESPVARLGKELKLKGLRGKVTVQFDKRMVPHIFAEHELDAYYAQGYITAFFRLWQMDMITRASGGFVAEVVGPIGLQNDLEKRRMGVLGAAEKMAEALSKDSLTRSIVDAYTAGINAYVDELHPAHYPLEYKILDFAPTHWTPLHTALIQKYISWDMAFHVNDWEVTNARERFGDEAVAQLYPDWPAVLDPIIPQGTPLDFKPLKLPEAPKQPREALKDQPRHLANAVIPVPPHSNENPGIGSNNWALAGSKTAGGYPLLAFDPHLRLTLPSVWFEMQMTAPGLDVYGVNLTGAPGIAVGFNRHIAWGQTNTGPDVLDFYRIQFQDAAQTHYRYAGEWKPTTQRIETIKVRGRKPVQDTVIYTHHGPVPYARAGKESTDGRTALAVRWLGHEVTRELTALHEMNRAKNYDQFVQALQNFQCPAFNFAFADVHNDIGLWVNGKFPLKWWGQGKTVGDGSDPRYDWGGFLPHSHNPHVKNPVRGFVSSANQHSAGPAYPYYINWDFETYERGHRINTRLTAMKNATPDSLRLLQLDNQNTHARSILPTMLGYLKNAQLDANEQQLLAELEKWNYQNDADKTAPTIFYTWWRVLVRNIFTDELGGGKYIFPKQSVVANMMKTDTTARWYDDVRTPEKETLRQQVCRSFAKTADSLVKRLGAPGAAWQWGPYKNTKLAHLANFPGMSRSVPVGGGNAIVNAATSTNGPSWRMVVELDPRGVRAYGIYPGGQSGNPGSRHYDDFVDMWSKGELAPLNFMQAPATGTDVVTLYMLP
jgi:penicillin amidase